MQGMAPSGAQVVAPGAVFYRIVEGRIVEFRGQMDMGAVLQKIQSAGAWSPVH